MKRIIEIEIGYCGDCPFYNWKRHKCNKGANHQFDHIHVPNHKKWRDKNGDKQPGFLQKVFGR